MKLTGFLFCFLFTSISLHAAQASEINYQGRLADIDGNPASGSKTFIVKIYDAETAGNVISTEAIGPVDIDITGIYNFQFNISDTTILKDNECWLELTIDGAIQSQREKILPVPLALNVPDASINLRELADELKSMLVPTGSVMAYAGNSAPTGWAICDGSTLSRTNNDELYQVIGTAHGAGDGATTFHLPDYRGRFLRGVDTGALRDPDVATRQPMNSGGNTGDAVGSVQEDAFEAHDHRLDWDLQIIATGPNSTSYGSDRSRTSKTETAGQSSETRPLNAYVNYIIKL